ncbi:TPA: hypothetical protein DD425_00130 [Candidatus Saccharibacteria bacterium]|nr:hypothetical protein [Candidatus Saccharibacteria bacterium]|tara:strand:- start:2467 stop:2907 length:441 start_codon:yes stop_codon:yes gene_type:complete
MFVLGGCRRDAIQETHPWHLWKGFSEKDIDTYKSVKHSGGDEALKRHFGFLFHAPIFGGWKNYIALRPRNYSGTYRIGWVIYKKNRLQEASIHKLVLNSSPIRLLSGSELFSGYFFAINEEGEQIDLEIVGSGRLGDGQFPQSRLF